MRGLLPYESSTGVGVYFVDNERAAARFGGVLRFPWPRDAEIVARIHPSDYYVSYEPVPPDEIEALIEGTWVPVAKFYDPDVEEARALSESTPLDALIETTDARYPQAGEYVDGLLVRDHIPNLSSIDGYFDDQETLSGIRVMPVSDFGNPRTVFYAADDFKRSERLAEEIRHSEEINPLIIGVDEKGPFIIEGAHRFVALWYLKAKEFPAVVVVGQD